MVFSEPTFLFFFLPAVLTFYFLTPAAYRNWCLLISSLVFYAWGEDEYLLVMLLMIVVNYVAGLAIAAAPSYRASQLLLGVGLAINISVLIFFKYAYFLASSILGGGALLDYSQSIHLPIGISFFTFQAMTYLIDLQARSISVQRNLPSLALYIALFPQLIAGPIVRYSEVEKSLKSRATTSDDFIAGSKRFIVGLAKKALIADPMGVLTDRIFAIPSDGLSTPTAWVGVVCYTLQIYFDFSAYSDMAIGLGRIFGFKFPENFNYPYISQSITEFWRRWHMTLSRWFRDYLYIPLGGNRKGPFRTYFNLSIVFLLCGLWHGASWNFVFWGAFHGALLVIERLGLGDILARLPSAVRHLYVLLVVMIGWTPFRAENFDQTLSFWGRMVSFSYGHNAESYPIERFLNAHSVVIFIIGVILATPVHKTLLTRAQLVLGGERPVLSASLHVCLLLCAIIAAGAADYSPFIYFRF